MPKPKSNAFTRIRAEVIRLVALVPEGKLTSYGSIATHMNVAAHADSPAPLPKPNIMQN